MAGERRAAGSCSSALSWSGSWRASAWACGRIRRRRGGGGRTWGCGWRLGRVRRGCRGLRRRGCWRRCGGGSGSRNSRSWRPLALMRLTRWCGTRCGSCVRRCRGRGRRWFDAVRRRARSRWGSWGPFPLMLVRLSRGRRIGGDRRLWRNWRRCCSGRRGMHGGRDRRRSMRRRGGRRRGVRRRCGYGWGGRPGRGRRRRRGRRGMRGCGRRRACGRRSRRRGMRRGGGRCAMWRRALLLAFRRLFRFSVRTEFALSLCNDDRSGLRVRRRADEVQRRQRR